MSHTTDRKKDLARCADVLGGSLRAWHDFVEQYAGLIYSTARKILHDEDEVRDTLATVLEKLHGGLLGQYKGRAALTTWLVVVSRRVAVDRHRSLYGRREVPAILADLDLIDRKLFELYYHQYRDHEDIALYLSEQGLPRQRLADALGRIAECLGKAHIRRLEFGRELANTGAATNRLVEFLDDRDYGDDSRAQTADSGIMAAEARRTIERLQEAAQQLSPDEREVIRLRFEEEMTAKNIADTMGLDGQRKAYTLIERALVKLKRYMGVKK